MAEVAKITLSAEDKTSGAFASAIRNVKFLQTTIAGLGIGAGFKAFEQAARTALDVLDHFSPKGIIDAADQLGKLSQRTGIAVTSLDALQFAGKLADVTTEDLADSLKKLNVNIAAAARGEKEQAE